MNLSQVRKRRINPLNAFDAITSTQFSVTNNTNGQLNGQYILVFLTPVLSSSDYLYAAWQALNPGNGSTQQFTLNQNISASVSTSDTTSAPVPISPGYLSVATNPDGLSPVLQPPTLSGSVTPQQSGVQNTTDPYEAINANWLVNNSLVVSSNVPLTEEGISAFELQTKVFWTVGQVSVGATYTLSQITPFTSYQLPAGTPAVNVSVTFDTTSGLFDYTFSTP